MRDSMKAVLVNLLLAGGLLAALLAYSRFIS